MASVKFPGQVFQFPVLECAECLFPVAPLPGPEYSVPGFLVAELPALAALLPAWRGLCLVPVWCLAEFPAQLRALMAQGFVGGLVVPAPAQFREPLKVCVL